MSKEEIENNAAEYLKTLTPDGWDDFENQPTYNAVQLVKAIYHGYEQGYEDCKHYAHDYYKPKWHDLRKNPNDLPKKTGEYFTNIGLLYYDELCNRHFWHTPSCEACDYSDEVEEDEVIAWCELPKFKE